MNFAVFILLMMSGPLCYSKNTCGGSLWNVESQK